MFVCPGGERGHLPSTKDEKESRILEQRWISVNEKLLHRDFIILIYDTELMVGVAVAVFNGKNFFSVSGGENVTIFQNVTLWMRLPNSPEDVEAQKHSVAK
jgi:hypothetical protein